MLFRRLVILASLLFVVAAIMSASAPRRQAPAGGGAGSLSPTPRGGGEEAGGRDVVHGDLPKDKVVAAHVGDIVELTIRAKKSDEAYVDGLGVDVPVEPGVPGTVRIVADRAGDFAVRLQWAGRRVGVLEVVDVR
jgi:hypothetical protein